MTMTPAHTYSVALRIEGVTLDPGGITAQLGLNPFRHHRAGDVHRGNTTHENGLWMYLGPDSAVEWTTLETGLMALMDELEHRLPLLREYTSAFNVQWWCGHFQSSFDGGPTLSAALFQRLATFGIPLFLNNYFSLPEDLEAQA